MNLNSLRRLFYGWCPKGSSSELRIPEGNSRFTKKLHWISAAHVLRILSVTLPIAFVIGFLNGISPILGFYLDMLGLRGSNISVYQSYLILIRSALNPVAFFIIAYLAGNSLDERTELQPIAANIFVGSFIGNFAGYLIAYAVTILIVHLPNDSLSIIFSSLFNSLLSAVTLFFVGFSAIAIASMMKSQAKPKTS